MSYQFDDDEMEEMFMQRRKIRLYKKKLFAHPDCRDPDHPGCEQCDDELWDCDKKDEVWRSR